MTGECGQRGADLRLASRTGGVVPFRDPLWRCSSQAQTAPRARGLEDLDKVRRRIFWTDPEIRRRPRLRHPNTIAQPLRISVSVAAIVAETISCPRADKRFSRRAQISAADNRLCER